MNKNICSNCVIHPDLLEKAKTKAIPKFEVESISRFLKALSDPTRLKIVLALIETTLCVCDITTYLNMNQSAISHQLRILKDNQIVKYEKIGKSVYYSIDDKHIKLVIDVILLHLREDKYEKI